MSCEIESFSKLELHQAGDVLFNVRTQFVRYRSCSHCKTRLPERNILSCSGDSTRIFCANMLNDVVGLDVEL